MVVGAAGFAGPGNESVATWLVFLGALRLINALFDWLSIGATR